MHSRIKTLIVFGVLTIVVPVLGIPSSWKSFILAVIGVVVITISVLLHREGLSAAPQKNAPAADTAGVSGVAQDPVETKQEKEEQIQIQTDDQETTAPEST